MDQKYASTSELKALREELGLSQDKCQELIGKGRHWWYWHEKGTVKTKRHVLDDLRAAFDRLTDEEKKILSSLTPKADPADMKSVRKTLGLTGAECSRMLGNRDHWWCACENRISSAPASCIDDLKLAFNELPDDEKAAIKERSSPTSTPEELRSLRKQLGLRTQECSQLLGKPSWWWANRECGTAQTPSRYLADLQDEFNKLSESEKHELRSKWIMRNTSMQILSKGDLKTIRTQLGLTKYQCSSLLGKHRNWWHQWEVGGSAAPRTILTDLQRAFDEMPVEEKKAVVARQLTREAKKRGFDLRKVYAEAQQGLYVR